MSSGRRIRPAWRRLKWVPLLVIVAVFVVVLTQGDKPANGSTTRAAPDHSDRPVPVADGAAFIAIARASRELRLLAGSGSGHSALQLPDRLVLFLRRLAALRPADPALRAAQVRLVAVLGASPSPRGALVTVTAVEARLRLYAIDHPQAADLIAP